MRSREAQVVGKPSGDAGKKVAKDVSPQGYVRQAVALLRSVMASWTPEGEKGEDDGAVVRVIIVGMMVVMMMRVMVMMIVIVLAIISNSKSH